MIYHESTLPDAVVEIIANNPGEIAGMHVSSDTLLQAVRVMVEQGVMAVFHSGPLVVLLRAFTPDVGLVHICVAQPASPFAVLRGAREFAAWAGEETRYHKLEGRTHNLRLALLATHCGAEIEGMRRESYRMPDGSMADEYELGYILSSTKH